MKCKKIIIPIIVVLVLSCFLFIINFVQKYKYKTIILIEEPDYIGSSRYGEEIAVVTDGELVLYNKEGEARNIELDINVEKAYPFQNSIWIIDDRLNLYKVTYGSGGEIILSDIILPDIIHIEYNMIQTAAISANGELYVWGDNSYGELGIANKEFIDEPTKVDYIDNVKSCVLHNGFSVLLTEEGEVYVAGYNMDGDSSIREFTHLGKLNGIKNIKGSNYYIYTEKDDGTILVWDSLKSDTKEDLEIGRIVQNTTDAINSLGINQFSMGLRFALGLDSQGRLYYWESDFIEGQVGKGDYNFFYKPRKIFGIGTVDSIYGTMLDAYAKKGLVIYIIPGK